MLKNKKLNKTFLMDQYIDKNKTVKIIAKEIKCSKSTIMRRFKKYDIKIKTISEAKKGRKIKNVWGEILTKRFLIREYIINKKTLKLIADEIKCSISVVQTYLKKYNIERRISSVFKKLNILTKEFLLEQYTNQKKSMKIIGKEMKTNSTTVRNYLILHGIQIRSTTEVLKGKKGRKNSKETRRKIRDNHADVSGENNPNFAKICSKETRSKISLGNGGTGIPYENKDYPQEFNDKLKQKIRKRDNYTCQICGMTEEEHIIVYGVNLSIHHIDYNKKNSSKDDLTSLCIPCHARTNYNRKYWVDYFQKKIGVK